MLTVKINSRTIEGKSRLQVAPLDINNVRTFVLIGDTAPLVGDGSDGYYFLDTSGDISFYKKIAGAWVLQSTFKGDQGDQGIQGIQGLTGANAYVYIAYASDASGTGFTMTFDANLNYIAIKTTTVAIGSPAVGDFAGLWKNYKGATGAAGADGNDGSNGSNGSDGADAYVYIAYASDASGTGFTMTFDANLNYIAIKTTTVAI